MSSEDVVGGVQDATHTIELAVKQDGQEAPTTTSSQGFKLITANPTGKSDPLLTQALEETGGLTESSYAVKPNTSEKLSRSTIAIVASVVGFVVLMILLALFVTLKRRRKRARYQKTHHDESLAPSIAQDVKASKSEKPARKGGYFSVAMYSKRRKPNHPKVVEQQVVPQRAYTPVKAPFELPGDSTWMKSKFMTSTIWDGYTKVQNAVPIMVGTPIMVDTSYKGVGERRRTLFPGEEEKKRLDELFESEPNLYESGGGEQGRNKEFGLSREERKMLEQRDEGHLYPHPAEGSKAREGPSRAPTNATFGPSRNGKSPLSLTNIDEMRERLEAEYPAGEASRYEVNPLRNSELLLYPERCKTPPLDKSLPSRTPTNSTFGPPTTKLAFNAFSPTDFEPITKDQTEYPAGEAKRFHIPSRSNSNSSISSLSGTVDAATNNPISPLAPANKPKPVSLYTPIGLGVTLPTTNLDTVLDTTVNPLVPASRTPAPELSTKLPSFLPLSQTPLLPTSYISSPTFETYQTYSTPRIPAPLETSLPPQLPKHTPFTPINPTALQFVKAESFLEPATPDSPASSMALPQLGDERSSWGTLEGNYIKALERKKLLQELADAELQVERLKKELKEKKREEAMAKTVAKSRKKSEKELKEKEVMISRNRMRLVELGSSSGSANSTEKEDAGYIGASDTDRERGEESTDATDISRAGSTTKLIPDGGVKRRSTLMYYNGGEAGPGGRGIFDPRGIWANSESETSFNDGYGEDCNTV